MRDELPFPDKVLQTLHNLCATAADLARRGEEVARLMQKDPVEIESILDQYKSEGFAESFFDNEGKKTVLSYWKRNNQSLLAFHVVKTCV